MLFAFGCLVIKRTEGPSFAFKFRCLHGKIDAIKKVNSSRLFCRVERASSFLFLHEIPVSWSLNPFYSSP
jgi:hypothetical protein